jgi:hypothetical protein
VFVMPSHASGMTRWSSRLICGSCRWWWKASGPAAPSWCRSG